MKLDLPSIIFRVIGVAAFLMSSTTTAVDATAQAASQGVSNPGLSGHVGVTAEAYLASGISDRRDPASALVFGRASSIHTPVRYGFQFLLASEQTGSRQSMSRFSANISYEFVRASLGDLSPVLSRYSLNGTTVRGAALEFTTGTALVSVMGGRLRRPIGSAATFGLSRRSYREMLYAARVGAGASDKSHLHVVGVVARDARNTLADSLDVPPRENVSLTPDAKLLLWNSRLELGATYTVSAFSADTRASPSDANVSSMLGFFTTRVGSRIDYATDLYARVSLPDFRARLSYERIQPGFRSLGLWQTRSDQATFRLEPTVLLANRRANVSLRFASSHNNLEGNRAATLRRRSVYLLGTFRLSRVTAFTAAYSNFRSLNKLDELSVTGPIRDQKNVAQMFMISPTFTLARGLSVHVISLSTSYQFLRDKTAETELAAADFDNFNATAAYNVALPGGTSVSASGGFLSSTTPLVDAGAFSFSAGAGRSFANRRANVGLTAGWSRNSLNVRSTGDALVSELNSTQISARLTGSYRVQSGSVIRLSLRGLRSAGTLTPPFREMQTSLTIEHRF